MSDRRLAIAIAGIATLGVGVAGYLTYVHYAGIDPQCVVGHGCARVQASRWAELAGVPVATLGLAGYVAILASLAIGGEAGRLAGACLAVTGFGVSAYLTYLELTRIHAICPWCVTSAALMTALAVLTVARLLRGPEPPPELSHRRHRRASSKSLDATAERDAEAVG
jgi:uncharacterized membrane protein